MNLLPQVWSKFRPLGLTAGLTACLLLISLQSVTAQRVGIEFDDYHGYDGTVDYIRRVAGEYSDITELIEIGRSNSDRPMYVLVISKMNNGTTIDRHVELQNPRKEGVKNVTPMKSYQGKPGMWIDGGTHGNEYTGTEVTLYIIDKLVSGYGSDPQITQLIDDNVFYITPIVNPDGVYNSVQRGISQRQNNMAVDDDDDGKINEDGPDDLNGDGKITSFRYPDSVGRYVIDDEDPRLMVQLARDEETTKQTYSVVREDRDNDGDGRRGEDGEAGIDVNRNFPEGWFNNEDEQGGSGYYAASSPEAHAILEFFTNHTNILMVQSYHTSGGFTYRPFARWPDSQIAPEDLAVFDQVMGPKYKELNPDEENPDRLWAPPYRGDRPYGYGIFLDWAYAQFGAYSMSTELWSWSRDTRGLPGYAGEDDRTVWERALLDYQETAFDGEIFVPWRSYNHPDLGQGEIGGWVSTYVGGNALPGESLRHVADIHWQFELFKAGLLPKLEITEASAETLSSSGGTRIVKVTATVTNTGPLATQIARGASLEGNRQDAIWLIGDRDKIEYLQGGVWQELGTIAGAMEVPGAPAPAGPGGGRGGGQMPMQMMQQQYPGGPGALQQQAPQTGNTREVTWLVSIEGNSPLKLVLTSQKGGTKTRELTVR
ncbi:MAG: M14 family metallopeptidase [Longimicrobiales bacterium]|nr:M14 family metallopeptidase [Longimicrobiales bacterium]